MSRHASSGLELNVESHQAQRNINQTSWKTNLTDTARAKRLTAFGAAAEVPTSVVTCEPQVLILYGLAN